jgi:hydrogenase nickel incorporation protein HypA/HybF
MHEASITQSIVETVLQELESQAFTRVVSVKTVVGGLTHVEPENLKFWYDEMVKDGPLAGSCLIVEKQAATVHCRRCGREFQIVESSFVCPDCGVADVQMTSGDELILESIEVERPESSADAPGSPATKESE